MVVEIDRVSTAPATARQRGAPVSLEAVARLLRGLNREQRRAVTHGDGPQLVIAGPGTGKTETVTRRAAWLIATKRARPREILALTFTDNAAEEMQARVDMLVPYGQADAAIHTFHAFGDRLLREHAFELGLPGDVRLITRAEAVVLLRDNLFELGLDRYRPLGNPTRFLGALVDLFGRAKDECVAADGLVERVRRENAPFDDDGAAAEAGLCRLELATAYARYQVLLATHGLIDHGDQVWLAVRLLRDRAAIREAVQARYRYLLVDEFQDLNTAQLEIVFALSGASRNVTVVGDPDQAIYAFRGAAADGVQRFFDAHPDARRLVLRRNYRSHAPIIESARRLIGHATQAVGAERAERPIAHRRGRHPAPVRRISFASLEDEADGLAEAISRRLADGERARDFAVLARSNGELDLIARSLSVRGVPVRTQLPADFFAQPQIRPLLAFLRVVADPDQTAELYVMATGTPYSLGGDTMTDLLGQARRRHRPLWALIQETVDTRPSPLPDALRAAAKALADHVRAGIELSHSRTSGEVLYDHLRRSGRMARLVNHSSAAEAAAVARFFAIVRGRASLLAEDRVALLVPHLDELIEAEDELTDTGPLDVDAVSVLTVHRAKGLEFPIVYVTGLTDGRFPARGRPSALPVPWSRSRDKDDFASDDRLDEERRLFYVAMTRARDELWLTHHLAGPGSRGRRRPSPFIAEALDLPDSAPEPPVDTVARLAAWGEPVVARAADEPRQPDPGAGLSFSQLEDYISCPERFRLRHVVGLPTPPHHALAYGRAIHQAVAAFHLSRSRAHGAPLDEHDLLAAFRRAWTPEGFVSREHEEARFAAGEDALRRFRSQQMSGSDQVVAIERPFVFPLGELRIHGRMDRVDAAPEGAVIVDYKSSDVRDQKKADDRARDSLQLQVYALAHQAQSGALPHEVQLHFLDSGVTGRARPSAERLEKAKQKLQMAAEGIRAGRFEAKPNPVACGYCPFRQICPSSAA